MTKWIFVLFVSLMVFGTVVLSLSGCDDDSGNGAQDMSMPTTKDLTPGN